MIDSYAESLMDPSDVYSGRLPRARELRAAREKAAAAASYENVNDLVRVGAFDDLLIRVPAVVDGEGAEIRYLIASVHTQHRSLVTHIMSKHFGNALLELRAELAKLVVGEDQPRKKWFGLF